VSESLRVLGIKGAHLPGDTAKDVNVAGNAPGVTQKLDKPTPGDL